MITWVEIKRSALEQNIHAFRKQIGPSPILMPVVKSNAYGHGIVEVSRICDESAEVDRLAVVNLDEALLLRVCGIKKPIHVLSFYEFDDQKVIEAIKKGVIFPLYTFEQAKYLNRIGESTGLTCIVNLKIDCGTSRVGVLPETFGDFLDKLKPLKYLKIEGIWSHFSSSESDAKITKKQLAKLLETEKVAETRGVGMLLRHMACTAAAIAHPFTHMDAVRIGLGLYGLHPSKNTEKKINIQPVLSWKTTITQVKMLPKGTGIGYGGSYVLRRNSSIAVIPVGYYDGYDRAWSNKSEVIVNGVRCPVRGNICMNLTMVDVTKVKGCKAGDIVTLIGNDKKEEVSVEELALLTPNTINYEITTHINPLIARNVV
jgi:alanine racemase